ncbi:MAG: hypothetical protein LBV20_03005 [Treponema sp.]|nr:hypothetical protein [Treponema sp.]
MRSIKKIIVLFMFMLVLLPAVTAQSLKGMGFNGATGLYNVPTGRIGWEKSANLGMDLGYDGIIHSGMANIPKFNLSIIKLFEISAALDIQSPDYSNDSWMDGLLGMKFQLPIETTAIAIGGNLQFFDPGKNRSIAGQIYASITYPGTFFSMPAETTMMIGTTFRDGVNNTSVDFGMGFDLILLPTVFQNFIHWVTDFSNFSYSDSPWGVDAAQRGSLNTGLRIDLSMIQGLGNFKFVVDIIAADILDSDRSFAFGAVFGIPLL